MKRGISLVSLIIVIIVMLILTGIIIVSSFDSAETSIINTFALEILNIQSVVDEHHYRYEIYPSGADYVLDTTKINNEYISQFDGEVIEDNKINFKIVDMTLVGITSTEFGNGEGTDIYVLSETTGRVYYIQGLVYDNETYYTLTAGLRDLLGIKSNITPTGTEVKVNDVIFVPSSTEWTNQPITVQVKLSSTATINSITADSKSVSEETVQGLYKLVNVNSETDDKTGNYNIQVNYTLEGQTKTAEYSVTAFDNIAPTLEIAETENGDLKTITINAADSNSGIKMVKYQEIEIEDATYFRNYGKTVDNMQIILDKNSAYTIYVEDKAGNYKTFVKNGESEVPAGWRQNISTIYNKVPIPDGFVASHVDGENTRAGGLVIYEGLVEVTDANVDEARRSRNQFVWVPVSTETFTTNFVRKNLFANEQFDLSEELGTQDAFWEVVLDKNINMPYTTLDRQGIDYMSADTLAEVQAMYTSVKKYGGFYIARYEAGIDEQRTKDNYQTKAVEAKIYSVMGEIPYNFTPWSNSSNMNIDVGGAVEAARKMYPSVKNNSVVSTLTYAVQWDTAVQWFLDTQAVSSITNSSEYGNYKYTEASINDMNEGAKYYTDTEFKLIEDEVKESETLWLLTTGALKASKVNNIYDMAGNMHEWTMEGFSTDKRDMRGGAFNSGGTASPVSSRYEYSTDAALVTIGFRVSLYIK